MKTLIASMVASFVLVHGASLAEAQRGSAAPSGDVFSSSGNCQVAHQEASARINAQHSQEWPACRGASDCIRRVNAKKADALKAEGEKLRLCQASGGTSSAGQTTNPPAGQPTFAPGFRPGRPNTWKTQEVTWKGEKWAVYTDPRAQPWRFKPTFTDSGDSVWVLDRNTVKADGIYAGRRAPTATYRKRDILGGPTPEFMVQPGYEVENFPYAR